MKLRTINTLLGLARRAARAKDALRHHHECRYIVSRIDELDAEITRLLGKRDAEMDAERVAGRDW